MDTNSYSSYIFRTLFTEGTDSDITIKGLFEFRYINYILYNIIFFKSFHIVNIVFNKYKALGKEWNLHIHYLKQTQYFETLLSERWPSSERVLAEKVVDLQIPDENIDTHALNSVFGSLYCDHIHIAADRAVNVSTLPFEIDP